MVKQGEGRKHNFMKTTRVIVIIMTLLIGLAGWIPVGAIEGVDLMDLTVKVNRETLQEAGPVMLWKTDTWALIRTDTVPGAAMLLKSTGQDAFYLVNTYQYGSESLLDRLPNRHKIQDHVYLIESDIETMDVLAGEGLDIIRLDEMYAYRQPETHLPQPLVYKAEVQAMVNAVSTNDLMADLGTLVEYKSRKSYSFRCVEAGEWLFEQYFDLGYEVTSQIHTRGMAPNIIAEKRGAVSPEEIVIICGHYDSINRDPKSPLAPGADDNGTGTAATLQAAKIFADQNFEKTIRFIAFSGEEQGLYGSRAYAAGMADLGEQIVGVFNFDMIGYVDQYPEDLDCIGDYSSQPLIQHFTDAAQLYTTLPVNGVVNGSMTYSDHSPFWNQGYMAICAIEDSPINYPYYHSEDDTVDKIDPDFFTQSVHGAVAAVAELALPTDGPVPTAVPSSLDSGIRLNINTQMFHYGDPFRLGMTYWNLTPDQYDVPLFIILDVFGQYWFWPSWSSTVDFSLYSIRPGTKYINEEVLYFYWAQEHGTAQDLRFWCALVSTDFSEILGVYNSVTWGYESI